MLENYLILSAKHAKKDPDNATWWRHNSAGYTVDIREAGRFSEKEANDIARGSRGDAVAVKESVATKLPCKVILLPADVINAAKTSPSSSEKTG